MFETLFSERGLSLDRLKVLIEVRDAGSIAAAAPGDPVRQSQYSRQLRELSEFFGCEVAQRKGKILKLTAQGERLAELAREQLRSLEDFRAECRDESVAFTIGAGDSLIQWLVIPRLGNLLSMFKGTRFATTNLRTNEIVQQLSDCRLDFGIVRKNAVSAGLKAVSLGAITYVAVIPERLAPKKGKLTLLHALRELPLATQTTDGQFTTGLRELAKANDVTLTPALACQSFPQTLAAVKTGKFWAVIPTLALSDLPAGSVRPLADEALNSLAREAMLAWNPRLAGIRPGSAKIAAALQTALRVG
ncbi:MAG: LysR family transcriptional regulator [Verrucomicrobia bacterium]|nr:LysR family transcriptional regulator [Verrucomicrobiota bacterium]